MTDSLEQNARQSSALSGVLAVEVGDRIAVGACGSLLAQSGARVVVLNADDRTKRHKWTASEAMMAGKESCRLDASSVQDEREVAGLIRSADIILLSTDITDSVVGAMQHADPSRQIVCDITAFGPDGPMQGIPFSDVQMQAHSGIAVTTGLEDGPPTTVGMPFTEISAGLYAATGVIAALRVRAEGTTGQKINVALYDAAVNALTTFMPLHLSGKRPHRTGNRHVMVAPWNAYAAKDGWVLICAPTDSHWRRLCDLIGQPTLVDDARFSGLADRLEHATTIDTFVQAWAEKLTVDQCLERLSKEGIASGPIVPIGDLPDEENARYRRAALRVANGAIIPGAPLAVVRGAESRPVDDGQPDSSERTTASRGSRASETTLGDIRVVEIGQYTTAPLVGRHLAMLGADVLKVEPPGGDGSRNWAPFQDDRSYFFTMSNAGKRSICLDLRADHGREHLLRLLETADILIENLKPGALDRLGLGPELLLECNPRLICCSISGFGRISAYPGRPAFDSVIQAMTGMMDATRCRGVPVKAGISAADILGGQTGLVAVLSALVSRDHTGRGQFLDLCMQDAVIWAMLLANRATESVGTMVVSGNDGTVLAEGDAAAVLRALRVAAENPEADVLSVSLDCDDIVVRLAGAGINAARLREIAEVLCDSQTSDAGIVEMRSDERGFTWPLFPSPIRLSKTPASIRRLIGPLGEANDTLTWLSGPARSTEIFTVRAHEH